MADASNPAALARAAAGADLVFGSQAVFDLALQARARYANLISLHEAVTISAPGKSV